MSSTDDMFGGLFASEESERYAVLKTFFQKEGINFKTELTNTSIKAISIVEFINDVMVELYGVDLKLKDITNLFKELMVSHDRKGRVEGIKGIIGKEEEEEKNVLKKALGIG